MFARGDTSIAGRWWWTIDKIILLSVGLLLGIGMLLITTASPAVALKIGLNYYYFIKWHSLYMVFGIISIIVISMLEIEQIKRLSIVMVIFLLILMVAIPLAPTNIREPEGGYLLLDSLCSLQSFCGHF